MYEDCKIFKEEFVKYNKKNIKIIYMNKEYELCESIENIIDKNCGEELIDIKLKVTGILTNLSYMFDGIEIYYLEDISKLNTSKVTDISYLFNESNIINDDYVLDWDTSNVKDMSHFFCGYKNSILPDISK